MRVAMTGRPLHPVALIAAFALALAALTAPAEAKGKKRKDPAPEPAPATGTGTRLVIAPMSSLVEGGAAVAPLQALVAEGLGKVPGFFLLSDKEVKAAVKKAGRKELEVCQGDARCLAELGKLLNAGVVVSGEVGELGEGQVAYLKAIEVASAREIGSTTAVFAATPDARRLEARSAAYRLLAPRQYIGTLKLAIDVQSAIVYVDGKRMAKSPASPLALSVGTHALRVTHEQYRDFVRFVDVNFDEVTTLEVPLKAFPVITDDMRQKEAARRKPKYAGPLEPLPWYRQWYTVAGVGAAALITTAIIVGLTAGAIDRDREVTVGQ